MTRIETQSAPEDGAAILRARGICKTFAGVAANADVDFSLRRGEIHALLGENGAGKSTLASILTGLYFPDSGDILLHGKPVQFRNPGDALGRRIGMVHQHFHLVESFTVAENMLLGHPDQGFFSRRGQSEAVASLGDRFGLKIKPDTRVAELSMGERQRVEIVKMLSRDVEILFLDEPTAVLTPQEVGSLFKTLRSMAMTGKSIVLITHKLEEVMTIANRATIMRQGRVVKTTSIPGTDVAELARCMVGQDLGPPPLRGPNNAGNAILAGKGLSFPGGGHSSRQCIDFAVRAGEILGVAGVAGNGQLQLAEIVAGLTRPKSGSVIVNGADITGKGPRAARRMGLAYVPQDRLGTGLARGLSIADNLLLTRKLPFFFSSRRSVAEAADAIRRFNIKTRGPREKSGNLSGGNVQKVLLCREFGTGANAFVIASPTQGLDVAAAEFVHNLIDQHRREGAAILLITEDLDEICMLADRIVVIYGGRFVLERSAAESKRAELGLAMTGAAVR